MKASANTAAFTWPNVVSGVCLIRAAPQIRGRPRCVAACGRRTCRITYPRA